MINTPVLLFLICGFCSLAYGADPLPDSAQFSLSDTVYIRKNVHQQCDVYRAIFNRIYQKITLDNSSILLGDLVKKMAKTYDAEFLGIFKDGILIGRDYIGSFNSENDRDKFYQRELGKLWQDALHRNSNKTLTATVLVDLIIDLARIISSYKKEPPVDERQYVFDNNRPIFIIYAHPDKKVKNRGPAKRTFVDEYVGDGFYPSWLALFDVHSTVKERGTKRDAHFSSENGTLKILLHDLQHIKSVDSETKFEVFSVMKSGHQILQKVRKKEAHNDARILEDGLFLMFRETRALYADQMTDHVQRLQDAAKVMVGIQNERPYSPARETDPARALYNARMREYKKEERDKESILKNKDNHGKPFLSTITIDNGKQRALPIAYDSKSFKYIIIEKPEEFKGHMKWIVSHQDASDAIRETRSDLLPPRVRKAFDGFLERFIEIIKENHL